jgi:DNA-binding NtrC family response regulator
MHVLTSNRTTRSQLALLLRELGFTPTFYENFSTLLDATTNKQGDLLIDLASDLSEIELARLKAARSTANLIGFQHYSENDSSIQLKAKGYSTLIVLPSHAERAKARLKSAFRNSANESSSTRTWTTRAPFNYSRSGTGKTPRPFGSKPPFKTDIRARYLTAYSPIAKDFVHSLKEECKPGTTLILTGDEGTEHELAAREYNYQFNGDAAPLYTLPSNAINIKELEQLEQKANKDKRPRIAYWDLTTI